MHSKLDATNNYYVKLFCKIYLCCILYEDTDNNVEFSAEFIKGKFIRKHLCPKQILHPKSTSIQLYTSLYSVAYRIIII